MRDMVDSESEKKHASMSHVFADHSRAWRGLKYVYPVISRRAHGLSIGVNLNPCRTCNFDCVYCCVDRSGGAAAETLRVDVRVLEQELAIVLDLVVSGDLWKQKPFSDVQPDYRELRDIAFSGDGEPTLVPQFDDCVAVAVKLKEQFLLKGVKLVLITNATMLGRPGVRRGLSRMDASEGEVWAKLDAGSESYYRRINRSDIPLRKVLDHILDCGRARDIVIQSMFVRLKEEKMPDEEFNTYLDRLIELRHAGCRIKTVQLYTIARPVHHPDVTPLSSNELETFADHFRRRMPDLPVHVYHGVNSDSNCSGS